MAATERFLWPAPRLAGVLVALLACGTALLAQAPAGRNRVTVADVVVEGNRTVPAQEIIGLLKTRPGQEFQPATVDEDVRALYATRKFATVEPVLRDLPDGRKKIHFLVAEFPSVVQEIIYKGARHVKEDDLNGITGVRKNAPLNPTANRVACQNIVNHYRDKGRLFATCELLRGDKPGDTQVVFNIDEGPVVKVRSISFVGNHFVSGPVLNTHIMSTARLPFPWNGDYNPAIVEADIHKLEEYFRNFGFHDVRVSCERQWTPDGREINLVFHVQEGMQYQLKDVPQVIGAKSTSPEELQRLVQTKRGAYYNEADLTKDMNRIKDYLGEGGRDARVQIVPFYPKDSPGVVQAQLEVEERQPAKVGQIFIVGNERTRQTVILRQVPLFPGQLLSYPKLREAERNLSRIGIFNSPDGAEHPTVTVLDPDSPSEFKDILVTVNEQSTGSILFGVGVNSDAGLQGSVVLNERNFDLFRPPMSIEDLFSGNAWRGGGQEFRMEAVPGTQLQRYTISFREPFLYDTPYSLGLSGYYYDRIFNEDEESRLGGRVTLGRKLTDQISASITGRIENVGIHSVSIFAPPDYQEVVGNNLLASVRASLTYDTRDSFLRATKGWLVDLSYEQFFGDHVFPQANLDVSKFFTVWQRNDGTGRHVLALHSQVGWSGTNTPVYERFFAGGFRSIRGFEFRGVGPDVNTFKTGGDFMLLNSAEYQIPIKADETIYLVGFVDSGTVESRVDIKDYRVTAGFGVRFVVPMLGPVPIALDFGFPIVKGPQDNTQVFSFWLGFFR
jgi:outer membrane protein insertion porin family